MQPDYGLNSPHFPNQSPVNQTPYNYHSAQASTHHLTPQYTTGGYYPASVPSTQQAHDPPWAAETPSTPTRRGQKRVRASENTGYESDDLEAGPGVRSPLTPSKLRVQPPRKKQKRRTMDDKLGIVLGAMLDDAKLTFPEFLENMFQIQGDPAASQQLRRAQCVSQFLQGKSAFTPALLIDIMFRHPYGKQKDMPKDDGKWYCTEEPWQEIKTVREAMKAFAAQTVLDRLCGEAETAVRPENGLHAVLPKRRRTSGSGDPDVAGASHGIHDITWADVGAATVSNVKEIVKKHQPLTWKYALALAERPEPAGKPEDLTVSRKYRPAQVISRVIGSL
ncbi:uncharacterized protein B0H18DRAFT_959391 [Fomitopsis serialis]|uniref:uncharacterized protein n=1 Tax=Fomitopsis serialis TaxID=139415 RepID=UPI002007F759|nr:uncharacterized protein B0H18DRAFT_959391 [Neoantrodia serialis]KAH9915340.1 hypothetical protein B0H18DRAFT_959391 [Neoantrodia serialis]